MKGMILVLLLSYALTTFAQNTSSAVSPKLIEAKWFHHHGRRAHSATKHHAHPVTKHKAHRA